MEAVLQHLDPTLLVITTTSLLAGAIYDGYVRFGPCPPTPPPTRVEVNYYIPILHVETITKTVTITTTVTPDSPPLASTLKAWVDPFLDDIATYWIVYAVLTALCFMLGLIFAFGIWYIKTSDDDQPADGETGDDDDNDDLDTDDLDDRREDPAASQTPAPQSVTGVPESDMTSPEAVGSNANVPGGMAQPARSFQESTADYESTRAAFLKQHKKDFANSGKPEQMINGMLDMMLEDWDKKNPRPAPFSCAKHSGVVRPDTLTEQERASEPALEGETTRRFKRAGQRTYGLQQLNRRVVE